MRFLKPFKHKLCKCNCPLPAPPVPRIRWYSHYYTWCVDNVSFFDYLGAYGIVALLVIIFTFVYACISLTAAAQMDDPYKYLIPSCNFTEAFSIDEYFLIKDNYTLIRQVWKRWINLLQLNPDFVGARSA